MAQRIRSVEGCTGARGQFSNPCSRVQYASVDQRYSTFGGVMKVRPLHDRVLVRRIEEAETVRGGIIVPDTAKRSPSRLK